MKNGIAGLKTSAMMVNSGYVETAPPWWRR